MKNNFKKGFTLTELLAVIIIIGVILLIALPRILGLISNESENISKTMEDVILRAGELYVHDNSDNFPEAEGNSYCVSFEKLIEKDYLTDSLTDPVSNEKISTDKFVKVTVKYGNYEYKITDICESVEVVEDRPYIFVLKQTPSNTEYAQSKEIKVKYLSKKQEDSHYYIKVSESVSINNVVASCGERSLPETCSSVSTTILNPNIWYEVADNTTFTINRNMTIHAIMRNEGNFSKGVVYKETKIDNTPPNVSIKLGTMYTDRVEAKAICTEDISGIIRYEFSSDNGITWINTLKQNTFEFTGLKQDTNYIFKVRCTNGSGISETELSVASTKNIVKPVIKQDSQKPTDTKTYPTYASERKIKITYLGTNVKNPEYYFKSTIDATVSSGVITHSCGNGNTPGSCSASSVTTLTANTWYKTSNTTPIITYKKNGALYAMTMDPSDNKASASTFSVVNMDSTPPELDNISFTNVKTDRIVVIATCADKISGITKYEFSNDNGNNWEDAGTNNAFEFKGLKQGTKYPFVVRCTNGSDLKTIKIHEKILPTIIAPLIKQESQLPTDTTTYPTYASKRVIKITYNGTNVQNPGYYFKSTIDATVASGVITHSCGNSTEPGECSSASVTTLAAGMWYKSNTTTPSITYTKNGTLYAMTVDPSLNSTLPSTYTVANMDTTPPLTSIEITDIKTDRVTIKATCSDDISGILKYEFSKDNGATYEKSYSTTATTQIHTFTGLKQGTEYNFKVKCTNGSALTNEVNKKISTPRIQDIKIEQTSETKSSGYDYATKRVMKITYIGADVENPGYYFKSSTKAAVSSGIITHNCQTGTVPNTSSCTASSVTELQPNVWYKTNNATPSITYTNNGVLYAITIDPSNNQSVTASYNVAKVDSTEPTCNMSVGNIKTDRATISISANDSESGIVKYEFSNDNGANWVANGTTSSYTFTGLAQGTNYPFAVRCTNGAALATSKNSTNSIAFIKTPTIAQTSQTPEGTTYAQSRNIRITYYPDNIESPKYYYSQDGTNWTQLTSGTTKDFTYTTTGNLYAKTLDASGNVATSSTYTIANIDRELPILTYWTWGEVNTKVARLYVQATDVSGISKVQCPTATKTGNNVNWHWFDAIWDASAAAYRCDITPSTFNHYNQTYTIHLYMYDNLGNGGYINQTTVQIPSNNYAATAVPYSAILYCKDGRSLSGENCTYYYSNNEGKCGCSTYNTCQNAACGTTANSCVNDSCSCKTLGCYLYNKCTRCTCTKYGTSESYSSILVTTRAQFENDCENSYKGYSTTVSCSEVQESGCGSHLVTSNTSCAGKNSEFCYERNSCQNASACGTTTNSCATSACGCQTASSCTKTENEYKAYKCSDASHILSGNTCTKYTCPNGGTLNTTTNMCVF